MKKSLSIFISILFIFGLFPISVFAKGSDNMKEAFHLYVDINGNDESGNGSLNKPFATVQKAKSVVKTLDKTKGDIIVEIGGGTYELSETLVFDETDSGSENCTVRYIAKKGANPVLSGGRKVTGEWTDEGNGVYSIQYNRDKKLRALYVNGKRCYMTSNVVKAKGGIKPQAITENQADWAWVSGEPFSAVKFGKNDLPAGTRNPDDIELMTQTRWNTTIVCVESLEKSGLNTVANLQMPYAAFAQTLGWGNEYQFQKNNMIYNVFEWLDEPGEFYFDKTEHKLYYFARENENMSEADVVVPELEKIIDIEGKDKENRVHDISFKGLTFAHTDWNLNEIDGSHGRATNQGAATLIAYAEEDWHSNIYREYDVGPAAVYLSSASDINFEGCTVCHTGNDGISLVNDVSNVSLNGNIIFDTAGTSMLIGHPQHMYIGDQNGNKGLHTDKEKYAPEVEALCQSISITNNLFKNTSRLFWGNPGIIIHAACDMLFQYNQVENTPYSGLSIGWGWWNYNGDEESIIPGEPSIVAQNNKIINNAFFNCITTLGDGGAIYTLSEMPNTVISENYIKSIGTPGVKAAYHIRGIHIDEGTQHVLGERNVIDISPEFTCIDCGDWGKKGNNTWNCNYSTSGLYTTTDSFEPGTKITNAITFASGDLSEEAKEIVENAGIKAEYLSKAEEVQIPEAENIKSIPSSKPNIALIVSACVCGLITASAAVAAIAFCVRKKRKRK